MVRWIFLLWIYLDVTMSGNVPSTCRPRHVEGVPINRAIHTGSDGLISYHMSRFLFYSPTTEVMVFAPTKVMHTTIADLLHQHCLRAIGEDKRKCNFDPRKDRIKLSKLLVNATRVLVMRDPFDRALSAYINSKDTPFIRVGKSRCTSVTCTFGQWVTELKRQGLQCNEHFWGQMHSASFAKMNYDYIIRFGVFEDMSCLFQLLNSTERHINKSENNMLSMQKKIDYFTPEITRTLTELYLEDIMVWKMAMYMEQSQDYVATLSDFLLAERPH